MGMAAENEKLKLKATFFNNLGVAAVTSGYLVPAITSGGHGPTTTVALTGGAAMVAGYILHRKAASFASKIQDWRAANGRRSPTIYAGRLVFCKAPRRERASRAAARPG